MISFNMFLVLKPVGLSYLRGTVEPSKLRVLYKSPPQLGQLSLTESPWTLPS